MTDDEYYFSEERIRKEEIESAEESLVAWIECPIIQMARQIGMQSLGCSNPEEPKFRDVWERFLKMSP